MKLSPETLGVVVLIVLVVCAEVNSFRRLHNVRRYEKSARSQQGFIFIPVVLAVAFVMWTAGWVLGQKRICDQAGKCVWHTGTANR